jgi:ubiquinone biosynthesis protein
MKVTIVVDILVFIPFVLAVGWLTSRLLGVHLGFWRGIIAASIGWLFGAVAAAVLVNESKATAVTVLLSLFFGVIATMPISIVLELITRRTKPRRGRLRRWLFHPIREIKARFAPYGRLREVLHNARKQNLMHVRYASSAALDSPEFGRRLRTVLEQSGGMFVKFGQIASTRTDMLPDALTDELSLLRSDVQPVDRDDVVAMLESELGEPVEQAFQSFEFEPLAAASIGQTHRAVLHDGTRVVVKIQRPGIEEIVRRDAAVLRLVSRQLEQRVDAARRVGVRDLAEELIDGIEEELDYLREAAAGMRLRENRADDEGISIPAVHTELSTRRVLVMQEVVARSVGDAVAVNETCEVSGVERPVLAHHLLVSFMGQILTDGQYHADPHPGNVLVDRAGVIWLLDFGSVGRLDPLALEGLQGLALGFAMNDPTLLARAVKHLASGDPATDLRALELDLSPMLSDVTGGGGLDPKLMGQVLDVMERHGLRPPPTITLLSRALLTLEGTLRVIDPGFDLAREGTEIVTSDPSAMGTPQELIQRELVRALPSLRTMPENIEALANQLRAGVLTMRTDRYAGNDRVVVERWIDRVALIAVAGFGAIASALLLLAGSATTASEEGIRGTLWGIGFAGLSFSAVLMMRAVAQILRRLPLRDE